MADESYADLLNRYRAMETDQLKDLLTQPDHAAGESPASQALRAALESRQERFPSSERPATKREKRAATQQLGIDSNATRAPANQARPSSSFLATASCAPNARRLAAPRNSPITSVKFWDWLRAEGQAAFTSSAKASISGSMVR